MFVLFRRSLYCLCTICLENCKCGNLHSRVKTKNKRELIVMARVMVIDIFKKKYIMVLYEPIRYEPICADLRFEHSLYECLKMYLFIHRFFFHSFHHIAL